MEINLNELVCFECGETDEELLEPASPHSNKAFGKCHNCGAEAVVTVAQLIDLYRDARDNAKNLSSW